MKLKKLLISKKNKWSWYNKEIMAHGNPRKQFCDKCNIYGLIARFSENKCPKCGEETKSIDGEELRKRLDIMICENIPFSFNWSDVGRGNKNREL